MANVPATTADNLLEPAPANGPPSRNPRNVELLAGFGRLDLLRQFGLMIGLMASVAIGFSVVLWSQGNDYQPIYSNMRGYDSAAILEALDLDATDYRVEPNSGVILVQADDAARIRLQLASAGGSVSGSSSGLSLHPSTASICPWCRQETKAEQEVGDTVRITTRLVQDQQ